MARIQINKDLRSRAEIGMESGGKGINRAVVSTLIIKIFVYSAIKIKAKLLLLYSILNPETSSDSPSERSKGVRFVSAKRVINHNKAIGYRGRIGDEAIDKDEKLKERVLVEQIRQRRIRAILIS